MDRPYALKILYVASEVAPFAKVGGLGDVSGALPKALRAAGHDVRVLMPLYQQVPRQTVERLPHALSVPLGREYWCGLAESRLPDSEVPVYFLDYKDFYDRPGVYSDQGDSAQRYALLSRAAFQVCRALHWIPDIIHCNDWQTGLIPAYLNSHERAGAFAGTASLMTIHNLAYQGMFSSRLVDEVDLPWAYFQNGDYQQDGALNLLKGGLFHATLISTVSPTYAREIQTEQLGMGLDWVLRERSASLYGVLNGIDDTIWNPANDPFLPARYSVDAMDGKAICKRALQQELGLHVRDEVPLIGFVARLVRQKGIDVLAESLPYILAGDVQIAMLGSGEPWAEDYFAKAARSWPGRFAARIGYSEPLAHRIEAGCDLFLMPSRFEPCGLNQMYSMRYGTLPIVRATGGLEDSVVNFHPEIQQGTGFKLWTLDSRSLTNTTLWAVQAWRDQPQAFESMRRRAMRLDFSWRRSASHYESLYNLAIARKRGHI